MAPLKVPVLRPLWIGDAEYPWLRGHGSIEAVLAARVSYAIPGVSMAERSWLH